MRFRFLHFADCHLGYRQYNQRERLNDFARAFYTVIDTAIAEKVDFVLLAGDLFQKRSIDALTLNQALYGLEKLKRANIPCLAVEGNHEHAYWEDAVGWMKFLALRGLLLLLDPEFTGGKPQLASYERTKGSYVDPLPNVRVHGLHYCGASTAKVLEAYATALSELPKDGIEYTIFVTHGGVEGVLAEDAGGLTFRQLAVLRPHADYLALGHIHKPFVIDDWIYNPGSLETCSTMEASWPERGYFIVEVDTAQAAENGGRKHTATLFANVRRPFHRLSFKTDLYESPDALLDQCDQFLRRTGTRQWRRTQKSGSSSSG